MKPLNGKVPLTTGASAPRGIGRAIAHRLAQDGASVVVTDIIGNVTINSETLDRTELLRSLAKEVNSVAGSNNFLSTTPQQCETSFQVNILGPMMLSQAVIPAMRKIGGGRIINIGSTGSLGVSAE